MEWFDLYNRKIFQKKENIKKLYNFYILEIIQNLSHIGSYIFVLCGLFIFFKSSLFVNAYSPISLTEFVIITEIKSIRQKAEFHINLTGIRDIVAGILSSVLDQKYFVIVQGYWSNSKIFQYL